MSMFWCDACQDTRDADDGYEVLAGKEICGKCLDAIPEPEPLAPPRSLYFRLGAAIAMARYMAPEDEPSHMDEMAAIEDTPTIREQQYDL